MTALCPGGGASAPKAGVVEKNIVSLAMIDGGMALISPWLLPFAGMIDAFVIDTTTQCTTDPPAIPSSSDLDPLNAVGGILNPNIGTWLTAVQQLLLRYFWFQFCECTGGGTPTFVNPTPPTGSVTPTGTNNSPCSDRTWQGLGASITLLTSGSGTIPTINGQVLPYAAQINRTVAGQNYASSVIEGTPPTQIVIKQHYVSGGAGGFAAYLGIIAWNSAGTQVLNTATTSIIQGTTSDTSNVILIPGTAHDIAIYPASVNQTTPDLVFQADVQLICSGAGGGPATPCGTDPMLLALVQQILTMVNAIYSGLPSEPNSLADGTAHAGLTNAGTITLAGDALAVRVELTTLPTPIGRDLVSPPYLFHAGFILPIIAGDPLREQSIVYQTQQIALPHLTDQVGYKLAPGVVATVTELLRGP